MATGPGDPRTQSGLRDPQGGRAATPVLDVYETDTGFVLVLDMPGVRSDGLEIVAEQETVTIRGRVTRPERAPEHEEYELVDYFHSLALTEDLDLSKVSASLKDGVLRVTIPKSPTVQPRRIQIKSE